MKKFVILFLAVLVLVAGCATKEVKTEPTVDKPSEPVKTCPACDDNNDCTMDSCSESTGFKCSYKTIVPCCGNGDCESDENYESCAADCKAPEMNEEIQALIDDAQQYLDNVDYVLKEPNNQVGTHYYIKDNLIKEVFSKGFRYQDKWYDTVYLDLDAEKGIFYCWDENDKCELKGERADIPANILGNYIPYTPKNMIAEIQTDATIIESNSQADGKPCIKVEFMNDRNQKTHICLWNYNGLPIERTVQLTETDFQRTTFSTLVANSVGTADVAWPKE